jgi:hypothetical protein
MRPGSHIIAGGKRLFVLVVCLALTACHSSSTSSAPAIVFSRVPPANQDRPGNIDIIEGRVTGNGPGQRIVLYAKTDGRWGVRQQSGRPFTDIERDGRWRSSIQVGIEYAALLVDPAYHPPEQTESLPVVGEGVVALTVVKGQGSAPALPPPKTLNFSGYEWTTSSGPISRAGSRNFFDPANVWTDKGGAMHLRISGRPGKWAAAEVKLTRSLGYGTYRFEVRDVSHLEPSAVLTLVSWDGVGSERNRRELDVELSRWGYIDNDNAHYVVQPYYVPANIVRFRVPSGIFTHSFRWEPGQVTFSTTVGPANSSSARRINQHVFTSGVPSPGGESVRISLYVFHRGQIPLKNENEVIIDKFEYLP